MAIPGYVEWAKDYAEKFGFRSAEDVQMLLSWGSLFECAGYSIIELQWATKVIGLGSPPRFRTDHLDAINQAVRQARAEARAQMIREQEAQAIMSTCGACGSSGWVSVPHLSCVRDGCWVEGHHGYFATGVVTCSCSVGQRIRDQALSTAAEALHGKRPRRVATPLSLAEYEMKNPFWMDQLHRRKAQEIEAVRVRRNARDRDKKFGAVVKQVIERAKHGQAVDKNGGHGGLRLVSAAHTD